MFLVYRLRSLLSTEEEEYISEMISKQETTLEKQARMREKARKLRERREEERMAFVEEKLDQRWRLNKKNQLATLLFSENFI